MHHPRPLLITLVGAGLVVAACGGDDEGSTATTLAAAPSAVAESSPATPATPAAVTASTAAETTAAPATTAAANTTAAPATTAAAAGTTANAGETVTLLAYDSFSEGLNEALAAFTAETGIAVDVALGGDAGTLVSRAVLSAGNPEGDVVFGIDNTFLSRAIEGGVFEPYAAAGLDRLNPALSALVPGHEATPVDYGDVCVNADLEWFDAEGIDPPADLADLTDPAYRDLLVVQNPATSSPGMAFLLATVATFGEDGWVQYWADLRANGVAVVDGWTEAYYERFTWAGGGDRPLVVSYGTSPPAEVIYADPPVDTAPTMAIEPTCFRQVEFAGVLAGTDQPEAARQLVDFLASPTFQQELALNLFVFPAHLDVAVPPEFDQYALRPEAPLTLDPATIDASREEWLETWTDTVLR